MKRFLAVLCIVLLAFSLTACGGKENSQSQPESSPSSVSEPASQEPVPAESEPEDPSSEPEAPAAPEESAQSSQSEENPLYFRLGPDGEVKALRAGDSLGDWTLESYRALWREGTDGVPDVDGANFTAPDDAPVELHCTVYLSPMAVEGRVYWFDVAEEDYDKMPVMEGVDRDLWFRALDNAALEVLESMGYEDRWDCRIGVGRYLYYHLPMAAIHGADIVWIELE